jgi:hypothetical protein
MDRNNLPCVCRKFNLSLITVTLKTNPIRMCKLGLLYHDIEIVALILLTLFMSSLACVQFGVEVRHLDCAMRLDLPGRFTMVNLV